MITIYWLISASFGIAGVLGYFEYTPTWLLVELCGLLLICTGTIFGKKSLNDYLTPTGLCFFAWVLYANVYYLVHSYIDYNAGFTFEKATIDLGFFLSFTSVCIFGVLLELSIMHCRRIILPVIRFDRFFKLNQPFPAVIVVIVGLLVAGYVANLFVSGAFAMIGKVDRLTLGNAIESGKVWLLNYILTGSTLYYLYAISASGLSKINNRKKLGLLLIFFWLCYLLLGNRRGLLTVLLASGIIFAWKHKLQWRHFFIGFSVLLFMLCIGVWRQLSDVSFGSVDLTIHILNGIGEFYFPHITLLQSINNSNNPLFGSTFINWLPNFIAAKCNSESYLFLAQQFASDIAPIGAEDFMGYAYLPLTEAYINFGIAGVVLAPLFIVCVIRGLEELWGKRSLPVLVVGAMSLDINRGEFGAIVMQYIFIIVSVMALFIIAYLSNSMANKARLMEP